jgi:predicted ArsR family transcriptional regulator
MQILKLLYRRPLSVEQLAEKLNLQPITIRHHLQDLLESGIIEYYEQRSGGAGRPRAFYRVVKATSPTSFPRRQYLFLSEYMINGIMQVFGKTKGEGFLKKIGTKMGEGVIKKLEAEHEVTLWSVKAYEDYFVSEYLEREGAEPEILGTSDNKIVYRLHNCLFSELSTKMPDVMCDVLHESFHEGISKAMRKDLQISRATCMGHGDPYCEHTCVWSS